MGVAVDIYKLTRNWENKDLEIKGEKIVDYSKYMANKLSNIELLPFPYENAYYGDFPYSVITYKELKEIFGKELEELGNFENNYLYLIEWNY